MDLLTESWHWAFSGIMIVFVMSLLMYTGHRFGVSSSFRAMCSIAGGGRMADYFDYDWKGHSWLLLFVIGSVLGGFVSSHWLDGSEPIALSSATIEDLQDLGISGPSQEEGHAASLLPSSLFEISNVSTPTGFILFVVGGFLIGFGTRWAGGCTSGHAISGLSNLQLPSLVAVLGFFVGGLTMTHLLFPIIFGL